MHRQIPSHFFKDNDDDSNQCMGILSTTFNLLILMNMIKFDDKCYCYFATDRKFESSGTGSILLPSMLAPITCLAIGTCLPCTKTVTLPCRPALPVRPTRRTYSLGSCGKSNNIT